jgi:L-threonylcarbamoyladenylate synthase
VTAAIPDVVVHLVRGGLIAYPTETVYGLGSGTAPGAVAALAALKGREPGKPFLLLIAGLEMLGGSGLRLTEAADRLASAFWPGPLTVVLPGGEGVLPGTLRGPEGGIAVRWTSHAGTAQLIAVLGSPITSTSANRPRHPAALEAGEVVREFGAAEREGRLLILDAGRLAASEPSTVVDCTGTVPRVIRKGAISTARLRSIVPAVAE